MRSVEELCEAGDEEIEAGEELLERVGDITPHPGYRNNIRGLRGLR